MTGRAIDTDGPPRDDTSYWREHSHNYRAQPVARKCHKGHLYSAPHFSVDILSRLEVDCPHCIRELRYTREDHKRDLARMDREDSSSLRRIDV